MSHTFDTRQGAIAAGYIPARSVREHYRGFTIGSRDISGRNLFGYRFALAATPDEHAPGLPMDWYDRRWASSVTVWLERDLNKIHQPGAFTAMYAPEDYERGIAAVRADIDLYYVEHPDAKARLDETEASQAEIRARQEARAAMRAAHRSAYSRHRAALRERFGLGRYEIRQGGEIYVDGQRFGHAGDDATNRRLFSA